MGIFNRNTPEVIPQGSIQEYEPSSGSDELSLDVNGHKDPNTFDTELYQALVHSGFKDYPIEWLNREKAEYEGIRNNLPLVLLNAVPDFSHHHGKHFSAEIDRSNVTVTGFGYSPKYGTAKERQFNEPEIFPTTDEVVTLVATGGGDKIVNLRASRSLGLLAVGGGKLTVSLREPALVRLMEAGGSGYKLGGNAHMTRSFSPIEFLVNTQNMADVQFGAAIVYAGGGGVEIIAGSYSEPNEISYRTPAQLPGSQPVYLDSL